MLTTIATLKSPKLTRLSGFTLLEILLAMAISALTLSLVFVGLNNFNQQLKLYQERAVWLADADRGIALLRYDFQRCGLAETKDDLLQLRFRDEQIVNYQFLPDFLIRSNQYPTASQIVTDTFPLPTTYFQLTGDFLLPNQLDWSFLLVESPKTLHLKKEYGTFDYLSVSNAN